MIFKHGEAKLTIDGKEIPVLTEIKLDTAREDRSMQAEETKDLLVFLLVCFVTVAALFAVFFF